MDTKKTTPKISDFATHSVSPFIVEIHSKLYTPDPKHRYMQGDDGKEYGMYEIPKSKAILHDPKPYTKVMRGNSLLFATLNEASAKMLYYICDNLQPGKDEICIFKDDYLSFFGYKATNRFVYYKAIEGLLKASIIARKVSSTTCFFINPDILFNGDRTKLKSIVILPPAGSHKVNTEEHRKGL